MQERGNLGKGEKIVRDLLSYAMHMHYSQSLLLDVLAFFIFLIPFWRLLVGGYDHWTRGVRVRLIHVEYDANPYIASLSVGCFWTLAFGLVCTAHPRFLPALIYVIPIIGDVFNALHVFEDLKSFAIFGVVFNSVLAFILRKYVKAQFSPEIDLPEAAIEAYEEQLEEEEEEEEKARKLRLKERQIEEVKHGLEREHELAEELESEQETN